MAGVSHFSFFSFAGRRVLYPIIWCSADQINQHRETYISYVIHVFNTILIIPSSTGAIKPRTWTMNVGVSCPIFLQWQRWNETLNWKRGYNSSLCVDSSLVVMQVHIFEDILKKHILIVFFARYHNIYVAFILENPVQIDLYVSFSRPNVKIQPSLSIVIDGYNNNIIKYSRAKVEKRSHI